MVTGTAADIIARTKALLPNWFGDNQQNADALLAGPAAAGQIVYDRIEYAALQTRIDTATDGFLDLIAADYFGSSIVRAPNQSDDSLRSTILVNLFRPRATRAAVLSAVKQVTGVDATMFEPERPADTRAYGLACGYGVAGSYGSTLLPYQAFLIAPRPLASGIPNVAGYGISTGAYSTPSRATYASIKDVHNAIADADIYAAIEAVRPVGTIIWTAITLPPVASSPQIPRTTSTGSLRTVSDGSTRTVA
jgi:hypothetical protein